VPASGRRHNAREMLRRRNRRYTLAVALQLSVVLGLVFGVLAGACAFAISYAEYKRNWSFRGSAAKMAVRSALVAFVFFFLAALGLSAVLKMVM
jgi:hypothetical protein